MQRLISGTRSHCTAAAPHSCASSFKVYWRNDKLVLVGEMLAAVGRMIRNYSMVCCLFIFISSCNQRLYQPVKLISLEQVFNDTILMLPPRYTYVEYVSHELHDKKFWVFKYDSSTYFKIFSDELKDHFTNPKVIFSNRHLFGKTIIDSCFILLSKGSKDSAELYLRESFDASTIENRIGVLKVDFKMNKEPGTSGLGPVGNFSPFGDYCLYFFVLDKSKIVYYNSMRRHASLFNRLYTKKRSRNAIKAFFK